MVVEEPLHSKLHHYWRGSILNSGEPCVETLIGVLFGWMFFFACFFVVVLFCISLQFVSAASRHDGCQIWLRKRRRHHLDMDGSSCDEVEWGRLIFWLNTCSTGNTESNNLMVGQPTFGWWSWSDWHFKVSEVRLTINVLKNVTLVISVIVFNFLNYQKVSRISLNEEVRLNQTMEPTSWWSHELALASSRMISKSLRGFMFFRAMKRIPPPPTLGVLNRQLCSLW